MTDEPDPYRYVTKYPADTMRQLMLDPGLRQVEYTKEVSNDRK